MVNPPTEAVLEMLELAFWHEYYEDKAASVFTHAITEKLIEQKEIVRQKNGGTPITFESREEAADILKDAGRWDSRWKEAG